MACAEEGCVMETLSAFLLDEALAHAQDPAVLAVLRRMKRDEDRHAALAWEILKWALSRDGTMVKATEEALLGAMGRVGVQNFAHPVELEAFGLLGMEKAEAGKRAALGGVIQPCWEAMKGLMA